MFSCLMLPPTVVAEAKLFSEEKNVFLIVFFFFKSILLPQQFQEHTNGKTFWKKVSTAMFSSLRSLAFRC